MKKVNFCTGDQDCRHTCELELDREADGRWLAAYTRFPGVAAYGPSKEEAIRNAAKVLIESEVDTRIKAFWNAQAEWSRATFGSDGERDHIGPLKHLAKEAVEAQVRPSDPVEIADCLFLTFDAARRSGMTLDTLIKVAEQKLLVNKARKWSKPTSDNPVEHVREGASEQASPTPEEKTAKLAELKQAYDCGNLGWSEAVQLYWTWQNLEARRG